MIHPDPHAPLPMGIPAPRGADDRAARLAVIAARLEAIPDASVSELDALGEQIAAIVAEQAEILPRFDQPW